VRASFQTDVNNKKKLDMHRTRITALREALFFILGNVNPRCSINIDRTFLSFKPSAKGAESKKALPLFLLRC